MSPDDPRHGTPAGYETHRRHGQRPCTDCREAKNAAERARRAVPRERFRYTYWEPSVGGTVTVYNVLPLHPAALVITCESCWLNFVARDITDHGGDDFLVLGKCECGRSQVAILPKRHPWDDHLSEKLPCAMVRDA